MYRRRRIGLLRPISLSENIDAYSHASTFQHPKERRFGMPNNDTLLAYLVASFPGNTENIATEALGHIFLRSDASVEALNDVIKSGVRGVNPITRVRPHVIHADGTIPDLVGFDESGQERVLIEVKFWAYLTANQPNGYLNRLPDDGPAVLAFLVPEERVEPLWPQLLRRAERDYGPVAEVNSERKCLRMGDGQRHLMIVSWGGLLDSMAARSKDQDEQRVESEIRQLRSLAEFANAGAFKPIRRGEEFGEDSELRKRQYKRLVDAATERGIQQEWVSRNGLRATPRGYGYGRYIRLHNTVVWFGVNVEQFEKTGETPLWVDWYSIGEEERAKVREDLEIRDTSWVPVSLKRDVEYAEILDGVVDSLQHIADAIHQVRSHTS
jgi:hypothetical protein